MRLIFRLSSIILFPIFYFTTLIIALLARRSGDRKLEDKRLVWGVTPIINNKYWSDSMKGVGFFSETYMHSFYEKINKREDFDHILTEKYYWAPRYLKPLIAFWVSLFRYDIFFISFDGYFLGTSPLWCFESHFFKIAKKKVVVIPYGSDAYVYRSMKSTSSAHVLMMSYPLLARQQRRISKRVEYWCTYADCVIPGLMTPEGFGRWDVLLPSVLFLDTSRWKVSQRKSEANGVDGTVYISHASNHRGAKGTEFVIDAVKKLQDRGLKVELILLEGIPNDKVREILQSAVDIHVEKVIGAGYALSGLEGMASGLPVITTLDDINFLEVFYRYSFLGECPAVSANPGDIVEQLAYLVKNPAVRLELGLSGRAYVEKYHGLDSSTYLFQSVVEFLYGRRDSIINLYHPILGEYNNRLPKITPLTYQNEII